MIILISFIICLSCTLYMAFLHHRTYSHMKTKSRITPQDVKSLRVLLGAVLFNLCMTLMNLMFLLR